jgi:hypothetical protein
MASKLIDIFNKQELVVLLIGALALAFGFSFRFEGPASLSNWAGNLILVLMIVIAAIVAHMLAAKLVANKFLATAKAEIWPSGLVALIVLTIATLGFFVFAVPWLLKIIPGKKGFGRPYSVTSLRQMGLIALAGPMANLAFAIIAKALESGLGLVAEKIILINVAIAVLNLVPFWTILPIIAAQKVKPSLEHSYAEGELLFFSSRPLWVFVFFFTLITGLSLLFLSITSSLIIAVLTAGTIWVIWHYLWEPEGIPESKMGGPSFRKYKK